MSHGLIFQAAIIIVACMHFFIKLNLTPRRYSRTRASQCSVSRNVLVSSDTSGYSVGSMNNLLLDLLYRLTNLALFRRKTFEVFSVFCVSRGEQCWGHRARYGYGHVWSGFFTCT